MNDFKTFLAGFFDDESFLMCQTFDEVYAKVLELVDMFRIKALKTVISRYVFLASPNSQANRCITEYEVSLNIFLRSTSLRELKQNVNTCLHPNGPQFECLHLVLKEKWLDCTLKALDKLMHDVFLVHKNVFLNISVSSGSLHVSWEFPAHLTTIIVDLIKSKIDILSGNGVLHLAIGNKILIPPIMVNQSIVYSCYFTLFLSCPFLFPQVTITDQQTLTGYSSFKKDKCKNISSEETLLEARITVTITINSCFQILV